MYFDLGLTVSVPLCVIVEHLPPPSHAAISTAALDMLAGDYGQRKSRKPEIMADAAYLIVSRSSQEGTGQFYIDDDVLRSNGVTDLDQYANVPGEVVVHNYIYILYTYIQWTSTYLRSMGPSGVS